MAEGSAGERIVRFATGIFDRFTLQIDVVRLIYAIFFGPPQGAPYFPHQEYYNRMLQVVAEMVEEGIASILELGGVGESGAGGRQAIIDQVISQRDQARQREFAAMRQRLDAKEGFAEIFATCIRCHNCKTACPICYCKTCLFCTASFDHAPEHYLTTARRKGAMRLLGDTLLFHLTRLNHMGLSCVSCGMCTSACPADIPVGMVFSLIGADVQAAFEYKPGQDLSKPLPLVTFQADEWEEVGEKRK